MRRHIGWVLAVSLLQIAGCSSDDWTRVTVYERVFFKDSSSLYVLWRSFEYQGTDGNAWGDSETQNGTVCLSTYDIAFQRLTNPTTLHAGLAASYPLRAAYHFPWLAYSFSGDATNLELWVYNVADGRHRRIAGPRYTSLTPNVVDPAGRFVAYSSVGALSLLDIAADTNVWSDSTLRVPNAAAIDRVQGLLLYQVPNDTGPTTAVLSLDSLTTRQVYGWDLKIYGPVNYGAAVLAARLPLVHSSASGVVSMDGIGDNPVLEELTGLPAGSLPWLDLDLDAGLYTYVDKENDRVALGQLDQAQPETTILRRTEEVVK